MTATRNDGPVALFAGGTAGLGEAILRAYARAHPTAHIYIVGRNETAAARIEADVRRGWGESAGGDVVFIKADLSLLANTRGVVDAFTEREGGEDARLDFLCMSQGFLTLKPRLGTFAFPDIARRAGI
jgi:NAD(P)-dependent dehydrogenase (short-subunit alcohol dehydrogenase family)